MQLFKGQVVNAGIVLELNNLFFFKPLSVLLQFFQHRLPEPFTLVFFLSLFRQIRRIDFRVRRMRSWPTALKVLHVIRLCFHQSLGGLLDLAGFHIKILVLFFSRKPFRQVNLVASILDHMGPLVHVDNHLARAVDGGEEATHLRQDEPRV